MSRHAWPVFAWLVVVAVCLDQVVKWLVETRLPFNQPVEVVPFLALYRTYNPGIAFSMLSWLGGGGLIVVTLAVIAVVAWLAARAAPEHRFARVGFALIIGGAFGNLIDRVLHGHVIDYVLFHTPVWSFAIFNLADAFITVGAGLVVLQEILDWRRERARR